jgi:O-antigen ligase
MNKVDLKFIKYSSFLFYLIPFFLINLIGFADLFLVFIDCIFLYLIIKYKKYNYFNNIYFKFFLFFYLLIVLRSIFSDNIPLSLGSSFFYFRFALFTFATILILEINKNFSKILKIIFIFILLVLFFDTIFQYFFEENILGMKYRWFSSNDNFRLTSFFDKRGVLGSYVARFFPFIIALFFFNKNNKIKIVDLFLIIIVSLISFILVILSGERTSLVLIFIGFILIFLTSNGILKKIFRNLLISFFLILILLVNFDHRIKYRIFTHTVNQLAIGNHEERIKIFGETYEGHFKVAYKMFKENPVFGKGVKIFRDFCSKPENYVSPTACTTHPHNTYVQLLAETGLLGFLLIFYLFIIVTVALIRNFIVNFFRYKTLNYSNSNYCNSKICLLTAIFLTLCPFIPSGNFFNNWLSIIYFFPVGFLLYLNKFKT